MREHCFLAELRWTRSFIEDVIIMDEDGKSLV